MSIQEKKSAKGTPYAIVKFSDKQAEFELFLFAEILISNREKLKESESFVLTFGMTGLMAETVGDLDGVITEMLATPGPVIADIRVAKEENCFPMIPSGAVSETLVTLSYS